MKHLLYAAEDHYLQASEIAEFQRNIESLTQRLHLYETLRDQEGALWATIADNLETNFPQEPAERLERALSHWIAVLRYGAMAMLLDHPDFLRRRLLEWLTDIIQVHQLLELETYLCEQLQTGLQAQLSATEWTILGPFLQLSQDTLLGPAAQEPLATSIR